MPAGLPGDTLANNLANPNAGSFVIMDSLSGPKGSPLDYDKDFSLAGTPARGGCSTGALATGIGFGSPPLLPPGSLVPPMGNFDDDYTVGLTRPDGTPSPNSTIMYIGGGKCTKNVDGLAPPVPYTAGFAMSCAGQGGSRDAGAGPAFTGFALKSVTAAADVAPGAAVEAGWVNRSGLTVPTGYSVFGSATAASVAPSEV